MPGTNPNWEFHFFPHWHCSFFRLENQILIPNWTYFHCPGTTLVEVLGEWRENQALIPDWT